MDLPGTIPEKWRRRIGLNSLNDVNPEVVVGLRGLKQSVWFVNSNRVQGVSGDGRSWDGAYLTMAEAVTNGLADDIVCVAPLHVESITGAAGLTLSKAGMTFIGYGVGHRRPEIRFSTATTAQMLITGAGVAMVNFRLNCTFDAVVNPLVIQAADCKLYNLVTSYAATFEPVDFIVTTAAADRLHIAGWVHRGATTAGSDTALSIVGGDGIIVEDFEIYGNFAVAAIENVTTACTNLRISGGSGQSFIQNSFDNAAVVAVTLVATSTGHVGPNINTRIGVDATSNAANITEAFVGAAMQFHQPLSIANLGGEVGMNTNITASTDA